MTTSLSEKTPLSLDIELRRGAFQLQVSLSAGSEILVLFGPSGAGKTTLLNALAGLANPDAGEITFNGRTFFRKHRPGVNVNLAARKRHVGYVFQDYALFPHLTALENVAYSIWRQPGAGARAKTLLERMGIAHLFNCYPHELSGGQKQRVAIARALAAVPRLLLLDEPFSGIDMPLRERLRSDIHHLQRELGLVVICVTHDIEEAFAIGHRLAVMHDGHIEQVGPVEEVFRRPVNHRVAALMGIHNLFQAQVVDSSPTGLVLDWDGLRLEAPFQPVIGGETVTAYIRPEEIKLLYPDMLLSKAVSHNHAVGRVISRESGSDFHSLRVHLANGNEIQVRFRLHSYGSLSLAPGNDVRLSLRKDALVVLVPHRENTPG